VSVTSALSSGSFSDQDRPGRTPGHPSRVRPASSFGPGSRLCGQADRQYLRPSSAPRSIIPVTMSWNPLSAASDQRSIS
jgi:hypothetical protein